MFGLLSRNLSRMAKVLNMVLSAILFALFPSGTPFFDLFS